MNYPFFIAKRYLKAKKSQNAINIISLISIVSVSVCVAALIIFLSVINGFDDLIGSMLNSYEPDLKISLKQGKVFSHKEDTRFQQIADLEGIYAISETVEENAMFRYGDRQHFGVVKGVDHIYVDISGVDTMIIRGEYILEKENHPYAIIGSGVAYYLGVGLDFVNPLIIYFPKRSKNVSLNPMQAFNRKYLYPSGIFQIQQDFDTKLVIVPLDFARELLDYSDEVSSLNIKVKPDHDIESMKEQIQELLGDSFKVQNRYEMHELTYKVMQSEKWMIFLILTFVLIIASFNIVGSVTMLIFEKKADISTLRSMGAKLTSIKKIFLLEGWLIAIVGTLAGLILGSFICWLQIKFGIVRLHGSGSFIINAYPVKIKLADILIIITTVLPVGYIIAWLPAKYITSKFVSSAERL